MEEIEIDKAPGVSFGPKFECSWETPIIELFEEQVLRSREFIAIEEYGGERISYEEINTKAEIVCNAIIKLFDKLDNTESFVVTVLPASIDFLTCQIAILKSGFIHAPMDPATPSENMARNIALLPRPVLITRKSIPLRFKVPGEATMLYLDDLNYNTLQQDSLRVPRPASTARDTNLLLFTSGSSGKPKGVRLSNAALRNIINLSWETYNLQDTLERSIFYFSTGFDPVFNQTWPFLTSGGTVVIPPPNIRTDMAALHKFIEQEAITVALFPPTVAFHFLDKSDLTHLKWLGFGGEWISSMDGFKLSEKLTFKIDHQYGLTEGCVVQAAKIFLPGETLVPSVGGPIANTNIFIVKQDGVKFTEIGEEGEIYIGGIGVAGEYYKNPEKSKAMFVPSKMGKLLRTRDLGLWRADGTIQIVGRTDDQVKICGHTVKLGFVEDALAKIPGISNPAAIFDKTTMSITAYYTRQKGASSHAVVTLELVAKLLKNILPLPAIPTKLILLDNMPITLNGKIDKKKLQFRDDRLPRHCGTFENKTSANEILQWSNGPVVRIPDTSLIQEFEDQTQRTPHEIAVEQGEHQMTFEELNSAAEVLAGVITARNLEKNRFVVSFLPQSMDFVLAQIATLKCSLITVPLDPSAPISRVQAILTDLGNPLIIVAREQNIVQLVGQYDVITLQDIDFENYLFVEETSTTGKI
ncbi:gramicidin S synthase 2 [Folsomia candida]|uniref:gramicidin S synthase 2 n=1 Tax=Folsomia candida TaxID=158441 RepID=UPI000B8F5572|nr:gramicidin S synthase 2 [Folsomia candida]